jgi:hypothetical protein
LAVASGSAAQPLVFEVPTAELSRVSALSITQSQWARAYYELQRRRGKNHHAAVRALAFKRIRIIYRCCKQRVAYDENVHLAALAQQNSPLLTATKIQLFSRALLIRAGVRGNRVLAGPAAPSALAARAIPQFGRGARSPLRVFGSAPPGWCRLARLR